MEKCPLTGLACPNRKHIHVTDVTKEGVTSLSLCEVCAPTFLGEAKKPSPPEQLLQKHKEMLLELFQQLFLAPLKKAAPPTPQPEPIADPGCPECGITINEIAQTGRLGCPHCYEHYKQELLGVLQHAHGSIRHVGKVPKNWLKNKQEQEAQAQEEAVKKQLQINPGELIEDQIHRLEAELAEAVKREHYEVAGQLRDAIKALREQAPPAE
jgi:protein arginine kinase activator